MSPRLLALAFGLVLIVLSVGTDAVADTWRVALDGSGDTDSIHEAGQLAASGDTISIAPGRYSTLIDHNDGWTDRKVIAAFEGGKDLTIVGDHRDSVVIGPIAYEPQPAFDSPIGLYWFTPATGRFANITIVNSYTGLRNEGGSCFVDSCRFLGNSQGTSVIVNGSMDVSDSSYEITGGPGEAPGDVNLGCLGATYVSVTNCEVLNNGLSVIEGFVHFENVGTVEVRDCRFEGMWVGVVNGTGIIENCWFNRRLAIRGTPGGMVEVRDNEFRVTQALQEYKFVASQSNTVVEAYGNIFEQNELGNIRLSEATLVGSGNHILPGFGVESVRLEDYTEGNTATIDLRNNWWGWPDSTAIPAMIWDGNDDPSIHATVQYMPNLTGPVPTEKTSLGGLKALFR